MANYTKFLLHGCIFAHFCYNDTQIIMEFGVIHLSKTLKQKTMKTLLPFILVAAILTVVFLGIAAPGLIKIISGPQPLDQQNLDDMQGKYVSFDASEIIVAIASLSVNSDAGTEILETYYLLPAGDGTYIAVMDAKERNANVLDRAMSQSQEFYMGDLETLTRLGDISGTVVELEKDMDTYMVDTIDKYTLPGYVEGESSFGLIRPAQINLDKVGFLYTNVASLLAVIGLVFLAITLLILIPGLTGAYQKKAFALVGEAGEDAFNEAETIEQIQVGKFIWYQKGASTKVLKTEDLVWGYPMPEPLVVSKYRWPVALYDMDRNFHQVCFMDKKNREKFIAAIAAQGHPFIDHYTSDLAQKFNSNFEGFVADANKAAAERNA